MSNLVKKTPKNNPNDMLNAVFIFWGLQILRSISIEKKGKTFILKIKFKLNYRFTFLGCVNR